MMAPNCSTVMYPPAIYAASYTVGALITGQDVIASFSSRGPVIIDGSNRIKAGHLCARAQTLAPAITPPTMRMRLLAARPWLLRTSRRHGIAVVCAAAAAS